MKLAALLFFSLLFFGLAAQSKDKSEKSDGGEDSPSLLLPPSGTIAVAKPEDLREKSLSGTYRFYMGTLHAHSIYSGDLQKGYATKNNGVPIFDQHTPAQILEKAKTNLFDFYFITDHSSPEQDPYYKAGFTEEHWRMTGEQVKASTTKDFLALRGYEFSRNNDPEGMGRGHMNVIGTPDWKSAYAPGNGFVWLYDFLVKARGTADGVFAMAQFNHPDMPGDTKAKNFNNFEGRTRERNEVVRLAEIWNSGEGGKYIPALKKIWSMGWKVAPTANTDLHGPSGMENRRIRTGVLSENLSESAILQSIHARRVFASAEPLLHLEFQLNGRIMGTARNEKAEGDFSVKIFANDLSGGKLSRVEIVGGKYDSRGGTHETVLTLATSESKATLEGKVPAGCDFYYACLFKEGLESMRAVSAPVWMDED